MKLTHILLNLHQNTIGIWKYKILPISLVLVLDNFGVKYNQCHQIRLSENCNRLVRKIMCGLHLK